MSAYERAGRKSTCVHCGKPATHRWLFCSGVLKANKKRAVVRSDDQINARSYPQKI